MTEACVGIDRHSEHRGLLGPAWRYEVARSLPPHVTPQLAQQCDPFVLEVRNYLTAVAKRGQQVAQVAYPLIAAAQDVQADADKTAKLMLMVLADIPVAEIAQHACVEVAHLESWEQIFFDCRSLRQATSWLAVHIVEPARQSGNPDLAARLKLAIMAGPVAVRTLLESEAGMPLDEAERLFQRSLKLYLKVDMATEMVVHSPKEAAKFLKMYMAMHLESQRLTLLGEKLSQRCVAARDQHERALLRLELQRQREEGRTALQRLKVERRQSLPKRSMSAQESAPAIVPHRAMTISSNRL